MLKSQIQKDFSELAERMQCRLALTGIGLCTQLAEQIGLLRTADPGKAAIDRMAAALEILSDALESIRRLP